jgi:hypothetical protein
MIPRQPPCADHIFPAALWVLLRSFFFGLVCATSVSARDDASPSDSGSRTARDWMVAPSKDGKGCFLTREYDREGATTLLLGLDIDGTNRLVVLNENWSIKPKDQLELNFRLSNSAYPAHFAVGMASDGKQGFVTSFGAKFPSYFAASRMLHIARGDVPVERLDLAGADSAVAELRKCVADQRTKPAAAAKADTDDIPRDPFAPAPKRSPKK